MASLIHNHLRDLTTKDLIAECESLKWELTELGADPNPDGAVQRQSLAYIKMRLLAVVVEVARRERLRHLPEAPKWPQPPPDRSAELREIKDRLPLADVIATYAPVTLTERNGRLWTCCPFLDHPDDTPSFVVDPDKGLFFCHGCHRGGDVFTFVQLYLDLDTFGAAADVLRAIVAGEQPRRRIIGKIDAYRT